MVTQKRNAPNPGNWIDISVPLRNGMASWPGDPPLEVHRISDIAKGDHATVSRISMGSHTGTHVDAPAHFVRDGIDVARLPLDVMVGPVRVIQIKDHDAIKEDELKTHNLARGDRVLFKTRNSPDAWSSPGFVEDFVHLTEPAAEYLVWLGVWVVGVDYLSVGAYKGGGAAVHQTLLGHGVWIIEGLDLSQVEEGAYDLVCLPLKIENGDGSPARAILRRS